MYGRVLLQGDTHGNTTAMYRALKAAQLQEAERVIQLGDFGYGWRTEYKLLEEKWQSQCHFTNKMSRAALGYGVPIYWFDGNHENFDLLTEEGAFGATEPVELAPMVRYIPRGTVLEIGDSRVLVIGGAHSVDKPYRQPHRSWWPQEEITEADLERCAKAGKVDVVLSHDVANHGFREALRLAADGAEDLEHLVWKNDRTFPDAAANRLRLDAVWDTARPHTWVHGHYHSYYEADFEGTHFIGLNMEMEPDSFRFMDL